MANATLNSKTRLFTIIMWALSILMIIPFIMMVLISFRIPGDAYKPFFTLLRPTLKNYAMVLGHKNFFDWYRNTLFTVSTTIILRLAVTLSAAYAFARMEFRFKHLLIGLLLLTLMVPGETTMVPRYLYFKSIGLLDTSWVIILPEVAQVFYLVLIIEFFRSIPNDFCEAALIDGCSSLRILLSIFLPLSGPIITTTILFSFINIWNNFLDPYLFINTISRQLITPAMKYFQETGGANIPGQLAGASLAIIPVILLFIFTQKFFVEGVTSSGIKG
ncbi:MAG: carbohydrate ABC transporter permease [Sphaerochaeta sp.]|jgi:multiple sugar transport system permease protein